MNYLDQTGLEYLWGKIKTIVTNVATEEDIQALFN